MVTRNNSEGRQGRRHEQRDAVCEQRGGNPVKDDDEPLYKVFSTLFHHPRKGNTRTRNPGPWNLFETVEKTVTMTVAMKTVNRESNIRWPNHNPTGFARPFDNCMACTDDLRSRDT